MFTDEKQTIKTVKESVSLVSPVIVSILCLVGGFAFKTSISSLSLYLLLIVGGIVVVGAIHYVDLAEKNLIDDDIPTVADGQVRESFIKGKKLMIKGLTFLIISCPSLAYLVFTDAHLVGSYLELLKEFIHAFE